MSALAFAVRSEQSLNLVISNDRRGVIGLINHRRNIGPGVHGTGQRVTSGTCGQRVNVCEVETVLRING